MAESQKQKLMRILNCSEAEAEQILADDKAIDKGKRMSFDLSPEAEKQAKKYANTGTRKPTVYTFDNSKRKRKENPTKAGIIKYLAECLKDYENLAITNAERQISFSADGNQYELTLVQKREKK